MFDFVRKKEIWEACDKGYLEELKSRSIPYHLKTAQDLAVYRLIRESKGLEIAEIGGGKSRILERLARNNRCTNIEKFEGKGNGPIGEIRLSGVKNVACYVGDFDSALADASYDLIFSISVVEHVEAAQIENFYRDSLRILKPGGRFYHAIDMYLQDQPAAHHRKRFEIYKSWVADPAVVPAGPVYDGPLAFSASMASNPDNTLYSWNKMVPALTPLRLEAQSVSLLVGAIKR